MLIVTLDIQQMLSHQKYLCPGKLENVHMYGFEWITKFKYLVESKKYLPF